MEYACISQRLAMSAHKRKDDGWSSMDEDEADRREVVDDGESSQSSSSGSEGSSWLVSDSSSDSGSVSESEVSSSSEEESVKVTKGKKRMASPAERSTRANSGENTPAIVDPAKSARKSVLDSLAKRRRQTFATADTVDRESSSSESDSLSSVSRESDFIASDRSESEGEGEDDPGFYQRVSNMMNKREDKTRYMSDSMSVKSAFFNLVQYYAILLVSPKCEFPKQPKKGSASALGSLLPMLTVAVKKIERELTARRDIWRPSYWSKESNYYASIDRYTELKFMNLRFLKRACEPECAACHKETRCDCAMEFRGMFYDSDALWAGDVAGWLRAMQKGGEVDLTEGEGESSEEEERRNRDDELRQYSRGRKFELGRTCAENVRIYHAYQHSKGRILSWILEWLNRNNLMKRSVEDVLQALNRDSWMTEHWFQKYQIYSTLSERRCELYTDPFGSDEIADPVKRIHSETNRRKSSAF